MLKFLTDENFNEKILMGLLRRNPELDIVRVVDVGLESASDPEILEWAAKEERILLTHDKRTIPAFADQRIAKFLKMPGIFVVIARCNVRIAIEDILYVLQQALKMNLSIKSCTCRSKN
jgi:predicted nuclease of predicted toxin-antitoxin system